MAEYRRTGFVHPLVHVNYVDRREPFCPCHDDPWALCPSWESWDVTAGERAAALAREAKVLSVRTTPGD